MSKNKTSTDTKKAKKSASNNKTDNNKSVKTVATSGANTAKKQTKNKVRKTKKKVVKTAPQKTAKGQANKPEATKASSNVEATIIPINPQIMMETVMTKANKFENAFTQMDQLGNEVKASAEALVKANTVWTKGVEEMSRAWFAYTQSAFEKSAEASKELLGAKTLNEAVEKQAQFAQDSFNQFVSESTKISEHAVKVSSEAFEPLKARLEETAEKVSKSMAA